MLRTFDLTLILCTLEACSSADHPSSSEHGLEPLPEATSQDLEQTLDGVVDATVSPGVSVIVKLPGRAAWRGSAGVADLETGRPLTALERFRAGSGKARFRSELRIFTQPATATAAWRNYQRQFAPQAQGPAAIHDASRARAFVPAVRLEPFGVRLAWTF